MGDMEFDWDDVIVALDESDKWRISGTDGEYYYIENISKDSMEFGDTHCIEKKRLESWAIKVGKWDVCTKDEVNDDGT